MNEHETPTHRTEQWVLDATDGYCPTCLNESLRACREELARVRLALGNLLGELSDGQVARLPAATQTVLALRLTEAKAALTG